jgi:hypothetical protein
MKPEKEDPDQDEGNHEEALQIHWLFCRLLQDVALAHWQRPKFIEISMAISLPL